MEGPQLGKGRRSDNEKFECALLDELKELVKGSLQHNGPCLLLPLLLTTPPGVLASLKAQLRVWQRYHLRAL